MYVGERMCGSWRIVLSHKTVCRHLVWCSKIMGVLIWQFCVCMLYTVLSTVH